MSKTEMTDTLKIHEKVKKTKTKTTQGWKSLDIPKQDTLLLLLLVPFLAEAW